MERHKKRANADVIAIGELDRLGDPRIGTKRPVLAAEILEHRRLRRDHQPRVASRDRRRVQPDLDIGIASDDVFSD